MSFEELFRAARTKVPCLLEGEQSSGGGLQCSYLSDAEADSSEEWPQWLPWSDAVTEAPGSVAVSLKDSLHSSAAK